MQPTKRQQSLAIISIIDGLILNLGPSSGNRIGNQGDTNVRAHKCNICYKNVRKNSK